MISSFQRSVANFTFFVVPEQHLQGHQSDSDADRRVRDIKGRPIVGGNVKFEEIDDFPVSEAIDEIPDGPGENECKRESEIFLILLDSAKKVEDAAHGDHGDSHEEERSPPAPFSSKDSESPARIPHMGEVEEPADHLDPVVEREFRLDPVFRILVKGENDHAGNQENPVSTLHRWPTLQKA